MKVIILAGGLGTRLRHLVPNLPKPMAPVGGRPFLEYMIERLIEAGLEDIVMSVGYRADTIRDHFGASWRGASITYAEEQEPLGTGGAIANAVKHSPAEEVLLLNGDAFLDLDFKAFLDWRRHKGRASPLSMVLRQVEAVDRYGAVRCQDGVVVGYAEKGGSGPGLINAGVYILDTDLFRRFGLKPPFSFETELLQARVTQLRPTAFITDAYFIDIGVEQDFIRAQTEVPSQFSGVPPR